MSTVDNERPPYITFDRRDVEDRPASQKNGYYSTRSVDMVTVTRAGSRDTFEQETSVWFKSLEDRVRKNEFPALWLASFKEAYKAWQNSEELPTNGVPIKGWPVLSPAAQKELLHVGIRTVEDLAQMPDSELQNISIGALTYKLKAKTWLETAKDQGKIVEQVADLTTKLAELVELTKAQATEIQNLRSKLPQTAPVAEKA